MAIVPPTAALIYRIQVEEKALKEAFGEEYVEYSKVTKRLVAGSVLIAAIASARKAIGSLER